MADGIVYLLTVNLLNKQINSKNTNEISKLYLLRKSFSTWQHKAQNRNVTYGVHKQINSHSTQSQTAKNLYCGMQDQSITVF